MGTMINKLGLAVFALLFCATLVGCSEEDSEKVDITFAPENPRVQFFDQPLILYTSTSGDLVKETIKAPWFRIKMNVNNGSGKNVVISNFKFNVKGISSSQGFSSSTIQVTPSALYVNKNELSDDDITYIGESAAGEVKLIPTASDVSDNVDYIYVQGLPSDVTTGVFNVEVEAQGWFGTTVAPTAVFQQKYYFTTD